MSGPKKEGKMFEVKLEGNLKRTNGESGEMFRCDVELNVVSRAIRQTFMVSSFTDTSGVETFYIARGERVILELTSDTDSSCMLLTNSTYTLRHLTLFILNDFLQAGVQQIRQLRDNGNPSDEIKVGATLIVDEEDLDIVSEDCM